ncbi:MAG: F420-dependent methylenetetrahydromethanopterin dehydrogenase [Candidatus Hydrothermarchaeales archaeon]
MKVGVAKTGNIASSLVLELLLDELAERKDLEVQVFGSGAKMTPDACRSVLSGIKPNEFDFVVYVTPNPSNPGPRELIEGLKGTPLVVVSDATGIRIKEKLAEADLGYIFITGDAIIGARREFLDPIEMSIFNGDMLTILSVTGAFRAMQEALDSAISSAKKGKINLPRLIVDGGMALKYSGLKNPYAIAKARAAYEMAEKVNELNLKACFTIKEPSEYMSLVAASHEMAREAAKLADEARELDKATDSLLRRPHSPDGAQLEKRTFADKPS